MRKSATRCLILAAIVAGSPAIGAAQTGAPAPQGGLGSGSSITPGFQRGVDLTGTGAGSSLGLGTSSTTLGASPTPPGTATSPSLGGSAGTNAGSLSGSVGTGALSNPFLPGSAADSGVSGTTSVTPGTAGIGAPRTAPGTSAPAGSGGVPLPGIASPSGAGGLTSGGR